MNIILRVRIFPGGNRQVFIVLRGTGKEGSSGNIRKIRERLNILIERLTDICRKKRIRSILFMLNGSSRTDTKKYSGWLPSVQLCIRGGRDMKEQTGSDTYRGIPLRKGGPGNRLRKFQP